LLPAVQKVREAASRAKCLNNMKQIGLSFHTHEGAAGAFPIGYTSNVAANPYTAGTGQTTLPLHGWSPNLLPYLEQGPLFALYSFNYSWNRTTNYNNRTVAATQMKMMQCPSAPGANRTDTTAGGSASNPVAVGDYAPISAVTGLYTKLSAPAPASPTGFLQLNRTTRVAEVTDGLSNTIMLTECADRPQEWQGGSKTASLTVSGGSWADVDSAFEINGSQPTAAYSQTVANGGTCMINCTNRNEIYSFHPGAANAIMGDGSVKTLTAGIAPLTLAALVTRAGGDIAGEY